jgi:glycogen(starch) synthase
MRVLFWPVGFWPVIGGVEVRAAKLLPALRERGHEFIVVTGQSSPSLPTHEKFQGIPIYRFPFGEIGHNLTLLMKLRRQIHALTSTFAPDLIHRNGVGGDGFFCMTAAKSAPAPLLITLINDLHAQSITRDTLMGQLLNAADWVTTVSLSGLTQVRQLVPDTVRRSSVIHNGLDGGDFRPSPLPIISPRLLCLGRLVHQKGIDIALKALKNVVQHFPQARLVVVGDGTERVALQQQAEQLGIARSVEFVGWIAPEQVPTIIGSATMLVMPSRWEGLPNVALQAGMMARPVVGTGVGGLPEIVEHERTGFLVEPENAEALAEAIILLLKNPELAVQMGRAARARIQTEFSWERYVDAYDSLYRTVGVVEDYGPH